jgi:glycosyltransferase involved in cell wall biosynthesis
VLFRGHPFFDVRPKCKSGVVRQSLRREPFRRVRQGTARWVCSQLGAREHYAVARSLAQHGALKHLVTDAWVSPDRTFPVFTRAQRERFHPDLAGKSVVSFNRSIALFELLTRARGLRGWARIVARNNWFQRRVVSALSKQSRGTNDLNSVLFCYSYTALKPFQWAKGNGWKTVLGQIDPGPEMQRISDSIAGSTAFENPPTPYWLDWKAECDLADQIVVNSIWSKECLERAGAPEHKIQIIPLAFESGCQNGKFIRAYPNEFSTKRPLRVLFLGQITPLKGVTAALEAAQQMSAEPIEFWFVGKRRMALPQTLERLPNVRWYGAVARSETEKFYQEADLFIFPTHCDGFGLTQLEAQAWKLPIIASRRCGDVVKNEINGILLANVSKDEVVAALLQVLARPDNLSRFSANAVPLENFSLGRFASALLPLSDV